MATAFIGGDDYYRGSFHSGSAFYGGTHGHQPIVVVREVIREVPVPVLARLRELLRHLPRIALALLEARFNFMRPQPRPRPQTDEECFDRYAQTPAQMRESVDYWERRLESLPKRKRALRAEARREGQLARDRLAEADAARVTDPEKVEA